MFSNYDHSNFPIVTVTFEEGPKSNEDFEYFTNEWLKLYEMGLDFTFIFDTTQMKDPALKYAIKNV